MSSRYQNTNNFDRVNYDFGNGLKFTIAELFLLIALGLSIVILMFLCILEFKRRAQISLDGNKRKKRVQKYMTDYDTAEAPVEKKDEVKETPEDDEKEKEMMKTV